MLVEWFEHWKEELIAPPIVDCSGLITVNDFSPTLFQFVIYSKFGLDSFGRNHKE